LQRLRVLRKIKASTITADDALFIRLHVNAGHPVKVSDCDYDGAVFDSRISAFYELKDIDLQPGQALCTSTVRGHGFFCIGSVKGRLFCYVLEDEINANGEWIMPPPVESLKEDKNMELMDSNLMQQMLSMKMLKNIFDSDAKDMNIGKLMMMQQVLGGSVIKVTDVIKAKIMEKFALDDKDVDDLPLEKILLLQMLDKGSIDIQQLIQFKMMSKLLEEDF
jgi:hypothetical protein